MRSSAEVLFANMERLYENIFKLLDGFNQASNVSSENITVVLTDDNGNPKEVTINSFQKLQQELTRIDNNYKSLINADNLSYTVASDGSISQQTKTSFINAEYLENFSFNGDNCIVDKNSIVDDLIFPTVKIPITIDSKLISDVYCRIFEIGNGWDSIGDNPSVLTLEYLRNNGTITYTEKTKSFKTQRNQVNYFGKFNSETVKKLSTNVYEVVLNSVQYTGLNVIGNSIDLKVDDILVSKTGATKFQIVYIDKFTKLVRLERIGGVENITVGIGTLYFNEKIENHENIVAIPVKPLQKLIIFISTENFKNISYPSTGIKLNTETYRVTHQGRTYTLDEFFSTFVTNFSEYLFSFVNEIGIPVSLGVRPQIPTLDPINFKFIQINKHLTDPNVISEISDLNSRKLGIQNDINYKQGQIDKIQQEIDTLKFKSLEEKTQKNNFIVSTRNQINILKQNLLNILKDIDSNVIQNNLKNKTPKYRLIGYFSVQEPIYSPLTKPQHIIKYDVQYRYLSKNADTIENTMYTMIDKGKSVSVAFSPWIDLQTKTLQKNLNDDGTVEWEKPIMDSIEDININQISIPVQDGESIELKIRAVSEAGYPLAPLKSEWSEILRLNFPDNLKNQTLNSTIVQNSVDLNKAEFEGILRNLGLLAHTSGTIREGEKTFHHQANDIASGQYTEEQKNIPLDIAIATLFREIQLLKTAEITNNVTINFVDFNDETFLVQKNNTMELFGGNYVDYVNPLNSADFGSIVRKRAYIKIRNNNQIPIEIRTLVPGSMDLLETFESPVVKHRDGLQQTKKQIIYFRDRDLTGQEGDAFKLYDNTPIKPINTYPNPEQVESSSIPDIVYLHNNTISYGKLKSEWNPDFVGLSPEHPSFIQNDNPTTKLEKLSPHFDRIKNYTEILKKKQIQNGYYKDETNELTNFGFDDTDIYAIGKTTCGAFLYPVISDLHSIQVTGETNIASFILQKESEILIPIIFEYRMMDRKGNINGDRNTSSIESLEYSKKLGVDIMINNEVFKFDINATAKFRSKIDVKESLNIQSVVGTFNNESPSPLD